MTLRRTGAAAFVALVVALAAPASAFAHAALLRTFPSASVVVVKPPKELDMTYSEAVEPQFATVSVTDPAAHQEATAKPHRSPSNPDTLVTPLRPNLPQGWYLVYWRVISADGHPVRGAFTFAVGPNEGPAPQFVIPSLTESAATPVLLIARWATFLLAMCAVGLLILRTLIARDVPRRVPGASLRSISTAFFVSIGLALVATPIYVVISTAKFAQRSVFDLGNVVPLITASNFGRSYLDFELVLALLALAGGIAIWLDVGDRKQRSVAALLALTGALAAAGSALLIPGLAGHAAQTTPRWLSLGLDSLHLAAGSIWIGGLVGLLVLGFRLGELRVQALTASVPRFSRLALVTVIVLVGSGIGSSLQHFPTLASLWETSYGKSLILKLIFLAGTIAIAAVNFTRTAPQFVRAAAGIAGAGTSAAGLLRILVSGEVLLVVGAFFGASLLTSLPPPPKALASLGSASAHVGPGPGNATVTKGAYKLQFQLSPNKAAVPNTFSVRITKNGKPVRGADVTAKFTMLDMEMQQQAYNLPEQSPGLFARANTPALVMVGRWGITFDIRPPGATTPLDVLLLDHAVG
jgi:copper transport protein